MRLRQRAVAGTTLAELLVAIVVTASTAGGVLSATTTAVSKIQSTNVRAVALSLAQDQIECARDGARRGVLAAGTRTVVLSPTGTSTVTGQALTGDRVPTIPMSNAGASLTLKRTITLEAGTADVFKVSMQSSWAQAGATLRGRNSMTIDTYIRVPCD